MRQDNNDHLMDKQKINCYFKQLRNQIISHSNEVSTWEDAIKQWGIRNVYYADPEQPGSCLCGKQGLHKLCELLNLENNNTVIVGSCCVKKFMGKRSDLILVGLYKLKRGIGNLNKEALYFAYYKGWITKEEGLFYKQVKQKQFLSLKQEKWLDSLNERILNLWNVNR